MLHNALGPQTLGCREFAAVISWSFMQVLTPTNAGFLDLEDNGTNVAENGMTTFIHPADKALTSD